MPLKIYRGGTLTEEGERDQLSQLLEMISENFDARHSNAYLVVDPKFPGNFPGGKPQIDCLFYREGRIVILELKNIWGKFEPTTGADELWMSVNADGTKRKISKQRKNPFFQVRQQRKFLISYFAENIRKQSVNQEEDKGKEIGNKIGGWIVTARGSEPTLNKHPGLFWSKVVPLDNVIKELSYIGTRDDDAITEDEFKQLLKQTNCIETNESDLFLTGVVPKFEKGRSPLIEAMIDSGKPEDIGKSIEYCRELSFINYFDKYKMIAPVLPDGPRDKVYSLLFEWLINFPQKFNEKDAQSVTEYGIKDNNPSIRTRTLNFLLASTYKIDSKISEALVSGLHEERYFNNIQLFIEALGQINEKQMASRALVSYYKESLRGPFFEYKEKTKELSGRWLNGDNYLFTEGVRKEYLEISMFAVEYSKVMKTWLDVASEINVEEIKECSLLHLRELLKRLQFDFNSEYEVADTLEETITTLGKMRYPKCVNDLLDILVKFRSVGIKLAAIDALSMVGDKMVIPELRKFLTEQSEYIFHDIKLLKGSSSLALAKLGDTESFDAIWLEFVHEVLTENNKFYLDQLFEGLRILNRSDLERRLWHEIVKNNYSEQYFVYFADFIKECASSYTFEKCKELILDPKFLSYDGYHSPGKILMYAVWKYDDLKKKGEKLGLEILKMGKVDFQEIGLTIAESYFLQNPDQLPDYENIKSEEAQSVIREIYVNLKRQDKIELLFQKSKEEDRGHLYYCLERIIPELHFASFSVVKDHKVLDSEFIVGNLGIYLVTNEIKNGIVNNRDYKNIPWKNVTYMKKLKFNKTTIGLVFGYENGSNINMTLIPDSAMEWDYLKRHRTNEFPGLIKLCENFEKTKNGSEKFEACFESTDLFKDIEAVFTNLHTHYGIGSDKNNTLAKFEDEFKPDVVSIE